MFVGRRSILPSRALVVASLLVLAASPIRAQEASEIVVDTIDVEVVNVEVVVTDRSGKPVRGLTRDDFVVREEGEPVELTNFYAVEDARRALPEAEADAPGAAAGGFTPLPADQRLHLVVLVDDVHLGPSGRVRVLNDLEEELDRVLRPGDRVLVARATPELDMVQPFTDDPAAISAALDRVRKKASRGAFLRMEERSIRREIGSAASLDAQMYQLNRRLLDSLHRFVDAMAGLPGRRAVLYVSEGYRAPQTDALFWDTTLDLIQLTRAAAGHGVTFYTLDAGSGGDGDLDPEVGEIGTPDQAADATSGEGLAGLAWRTGGASVFQGGGTVALLERMAADYRDYYSLGYRSAHSNDGRYHRIEVEVPGRRVHLRHTQGFQASTPEQETVERTLSALIFDEPDNPLGVRVELGRDEREGRRQFVLPILVRVPVSALTLLPGESAHRGRLLLVVAVQDDEGSLSEAQRIAVPVEIAHDRLGESAGLEIGKGVNLLLKKGESKLAVGVRDELSGTTSTVTVDVSVGGRR